MKLLHFQHLVVILSHSESVSVISKCGKKDLILNNSTANPTSPSSHIYHLIITNYTSLNMRLD